MQYFHMLCSKSLYVWDFIHTSHPSLKAIVLGNMQDTRCNMQYFHMLSPVVTLQIEPWSPKVNMSVILPMATICLNLKAIGEIV